MRPLEDLDELELESAFRELENDGKNSLKRLSVRRYTRERRLEMRYLGQGYEIEVKVPAHSKRWTERIRTAFETEYSRLYGRLPGNLPVEVINCRVSLSGYSKKVDLCPQLTSGRGDALKGKRRAFFREAGGYILVNVYTRNFLAPNQIVKGPAIIEEPECTVVVPPGMNCRVDNYGNLIMGDK